TFHGRDIFAPVAAWLAQGTPINRLGRKIQDPQTLDFPQAHVQDDRITGEVIYIDRFGNLFTNISHHLLRTFFHPPATPRIR
ncbi:MAG: hypothetical protein GWM98_24750, partial [Nitrospinaceae bacterium]|nr:SAM-dependent chlorinase/fluorinase [Nitrospinaceae bacterium]NIR57085.1 SAM-dependent chlorinase/fluorinase [Nitrospinaceae bacterium]NIS87526.1 SAM-dependent chlorinase/fluorinase [Nitrospinaceae bacterium]NIT84396.1 SAM-dependent chlorinase/fluorinase [Nitrospinaceae bacterium]NIU46583.1 SAM-dependent chlorinase/fluorinase [Nitrospinaceae bacterium]